MHYDDAYSHKCYAPNISLEVEVEYIGSGIEFWVRHT